jgi:hypothetical protein
MSTATKWIGKAEALAAYLETVLALAGIDVVVARQKDLLASVELAAGKAAGTCVVVAWLGGSNANRSAATLVMGGRYSVSVWALPIATAQTVPVDAIVEAAAAAVHGWEGEPTYNRPARRLEVTDVSLVPDERFLVYEILCETKRV